MKNGTKGTVPFVPWRVWDEYYFAIRWFRKKPMAVIERRAVQTILEGFSQGRWNKGIHGAADVPDDQRDGQCCKDHNRHM